jgi:serine/threonine-protein kinase
VKVLHLELAADAGLRQRFLREGYAANTVEHPGTARVLDDDTADDGAPFIVMELLDGETLDSRWETSGRRLSSAEVVPLLVALLDVLVAAHAKGVVHRDLKPENIFLTREGKLKVLDFGVARLREAAPSRTRSGHVFGTPAFMPPEQALGRAREVDEQSDIWAVGATAFALLAGRYVHSGDTAEETIVASATRPAPLLGSVAPEVPSAVAAVVDRALAFNKAERWPTAADMAAALRRAADGEGAGETERAATTADSSGKTLRLSSISGTLALQTLVASTVGGVASTRRTDAVRLSLYGAAAALAFVVLAAGAVIAVALAKRGPTDGRANAATDARLAATVTASTNDDSVVPTTDASPTAQTPADAWTIPIVSAEALPTAAPPNVQPNPASVRAAPKGAPPATPSATPVRPNCVPPFTVRNGIHVPKPECL